MSAYCFFDHELCREVLKVTVLRGNIHYFTILAAKKGPFGGARGQDPNAICSFFDGDFNEKSNKSHFVEEIKNTLSDPLQKTKLIGIIFM